MSLVEPSHAGPISAIAEEYPTRVAAACVCSLTRFPAQSSHPASINTEIWSHFLASYTRLPWESLLLQPVRLAIQQVLATPHLLTSKLAHDLTSFAHFLGLSTVHVGFGSVPSSRLETEMAACVLIISTIRVLYMAFL